MTDFGPDGSHPPPTWSGILIVDDSPDNLELLTESLEAAGHEVRTASGGEQALGFVQVDPPALILLDLNMPGMSGFEVCHRLKSDPLTCSIPVIFISAIEAEREKVEGFRAGGVDYITKPFHQEELLARVNTHLELRQAQFQLETKNQILEAEIRRRQLMEAELQRRLSELQQAVQHIKTLQGILPICVYCHRIRNDQETWERLEKYIGEHSDAQLSHGICPECLNKHFPDTGPR